MLLRVEEPVMVHVTWWPAARMRGRVREPDLLDLFLIGCPGLADPGGPLRTWTARVIAETLAGLSAMQGLALDSAQRAVNQPERP